jgi:hypothetical protein
MFVEVALMLTVLMSMSILLRIVTQEFGGLGHNALQLRAMRI